MLCWTIFLKPIVSFLDELGRRRRFHGEKERIKQQKICFSNILRKKYKYIYYYEYKQSIVYKKNVTHSDYNTLVHSKLLLIKTYRCTFPMPNKIRGKPETVVENLILYYPLSFVATVTKLYKNKAKK